MPINERALIIACNKMEWYSQTYIAELQNFLEEYEAAKVADQPDPREDCPWKCKIGDIKYLCTNHPVGVTDWEARHKEQRKEIAELRHEVKRLNERESSIDKALDQAAEILTHFNRADKPIEGNKLEEWQACYAMLFKQMNDLVSSSVESKWHPIETAPKDGTEILVCDDLGVMVKASWYTPTGDWVWWETRDGKLVTTVDAYMWMPLPVPPSKNK